MVTYTEYSSIAHDVYQAKGGTYPEGLPAVTQTFAAFWDENTAELEAMSSSEARQAVSQAISV